MKSNLKGRHTVSATMLALTVLAAIGCSTDENPTSPDKMLEIRKKEQEGRKNFNPTMSTPPASPGASGTTGG